MNINNWKAELALTIAHHAEKTFRMEGALECAYELFAQGLVASSTVWYLRWRNDDCGTSLTGAGRHDAGSKADLLLRRGGLKKEREKDRKRVVKRRKEGQPLRARVDTGAKREEFACIYRRGRQKKDCLSSEKINPRWNWGDF